MVNREKYHNTQQRLINLTKLTQNELKDYSLQDLRKYLELNFKEVLLEMDNSLRYGSWVKYGIHTYFVDILRYNGKKVGFVAMDITSGVWEHSNAISLSKVYILEEYRGKGIFADYVKDLINLSMETNYFPILLNQPNRYTINSLIKHGLLFKMPDDNLVIGTDLMFVIKGEKISDVSFMSMITPFYDFNLFSPVRFLDPNTVIVDKLSTIDVLDFDTSTRKKCLDSSKYLTRMWSLCCIIEEHVQNILTEQMEKLVSGMRV